MEDSQSYLFRVKTMPKYQEQCQRYEAGEISKSKANSEVKRVFQERESFENPTFMDDDPLLVNSVIMSNNGNSKLSHK